MSTRPSIDQRARARGLAHREYPHQFVAAGLVYLELLVARANFATRGRSLTLLAEEKAKQHVPEWLEPMHFV